MIGIPLRRLERCDSTNDEAAAWARDPADPAPHGAAVVAVAQQAGRGRQGRAWHSPAGNLYMSVLLRPPLAPAKVPPLTLCAGLAVAEAVNDAGAPASIKWPNDVLVDGKKIAGVLTEMSTRGAELEYVVVGIGLNVGERAFPPELAATSLALATGRELEVDRVREAVCAGLEMWLERYLAGGVPALAGAFSAHSALAGRPVRARVDGALVEGRAVGLRDDGALLLEDAAGCRHAVVAGEVHEREEGP